MNKVYKLVWNPTLNTWVAVSELAKGRKKSSKTLVAAGISAFALTATIGANAGEILAGATISTGTNSLAVGVGSEAHADTAVAVGSEAISKGVASIAVGTKVEASKDNAIAIGQETVAKEVGAIAIGANVTAHSVNSTAIGKSAVASGVDTIAFGTNAQALNQWTGSPGEVEGGAIAIGHNSLARAGGAIAIGRNSIANDYNAIALGTNSKSANGGISLGVNTYASSGAVAIGSSSNAVGAGSVSIGINSKGRTTGSVSIGNSSSSALFATAIGQSANASGNTSTSIGFMANASTSNAVAIGANSISSVVGSMALGTSAVADVENSVAIGRNSKTTSAQQGNAVITGTAATTAGVISVGSATVKRRIQNVADGADLQDAVTVAQLLKAQENVKNIIGGETTLENGVVVPKDIGGIKDAGTVDDAIKGVINKGLVFAGNSGKDYTAKLGETVAIKGSEVNTDFTKSDVGKNIYTKVESDGVNNVIRVALAKDLEDLTSITVNNGVDGKDGTTVIGKDGISVTGPQGANGEPGKTTTIEGGKVTTETIHLAGKDGKNGVDLTADLMNGFVAYDRNKNDGSINKNSVTLAGTPSVSTKNADGTITTKGGTVINNVASAGDITDVANAGKAVNAGDLNNAVNDVAKDITDKGLVFAGNSGGGHKASLGTTVAIKGDDDNDDFTKSDAGKNIYTQVDNGTIRIALAKDVDLGADGSIKAGDTIINNNGVTVNKAGNVTVGDTIIKDGSVTGLDNTKWDPNNIQNDRAATEGQLADVVNNFTKEIGKVSDNAVQYDKNADGTPNKNSITLAGDKATSTKDPETGLITTVGGTTINNLASAGDYTNVDNAGKAVNAGDLNNAVQDVTNKGLIFAGNSGANYTAKLGTAVAVKGAEANTDFTKSDAGKNIYTNVETDGTIRVALAKDLIVDSVKVGNTTINNDGLTITDGPSVTSAGINAGDKAITNVASGTDQSDAVNVSQMQELNAKILKYLGSSEIYADERADGPMYHANGEAHESVGSAIDALDRADQALNSKVDNLSQNLEQAFYNTNQKIDDVEKKANAGIAAAMALESAPYIPGKFTYAVGASYHGGENAVGVTLRRTADNGRWSITGGVAAASQGDPSFRIGISGVIN